MFLLVVPGPGPHVWPLVGLVLTQQPSLRASSRARSAPLLPVTISARWGASCVPSAWFSRGCSCSTSTVDSSSSLFGIAINSRATRSYLGGAVSGTSAAEAVGAVGSASLLPADGGIRIVIRHGSSTSTAGSGGGPPDRSPGQRKVVTRTGMRPPLP